MRGSLEAKTFGQEFADRDRPPSLFRAEQYRRMWAEFINDLPACSARSAGRALLTQCGNRLNLHLGADAGNGGEYCRALCAVGHPVRSVFNVTTGEYHAVGREERSSHAELGIRRVCVLQR